MCERGKGKRNWSGVIFSFVPKYGTNRNSGNFSKLKIHREFNGAGLPQRCWILCKKRGINPAVNLVIRNRTPTKGGIIHNSKQNGTSRQPQKNKHQGISKNIDKNYQQHQ
jgi:hypothetical protein